MPNYNKEHARRAISSGSILPLCVQNSGTQDVTIDRAYHVITDDLNVMGVDIKLDELKRLHKITIEEAILIVRKIKTRIISAIESSCGPTVSAWFELSFALSFTTTAATASERIY